MGEAAQEQLAEGRVGRGTPNYSTPTEAQADIMKRMTEDIKGMEEEKVDSGCSQEKATKRTVEHAEQTFGVKES